MSSVRTILGYAGIVGVIGVGGALWFMMLPGEDRRREMMKVSIRRRFRSCPQNLPEASPIRMEETRQRNTLLLQAIKEAAETNENVARRFGHSRND
uniref:Ubiquinol-cytochrome-c reductase complex assembly factor 3 n=1 Tax=Paramormyrops kingsleyae TaxID=1676925 RepID=A0A3B3QNB3_9TELE